VARRRRHDPSRAASRAGPLGFSGKTGSPSGVPEDVGAGSVSARLNSSTRARATAALRSQSPGALAAGCEGCEVFLRFVLHRERAGGRVPQRTCPDGRPLAWEQVPRHHDGGVQEPTRRGGGYYCRRRKVVARVVERHLTESIWRSFYLEFPAQMRTTRGGEPNWTLVSRSL
jgi:hypothetical protein